MIAKADTKWLAAAALLLASACASGPPHHGRRPEGGFAGREGAERPSEIVPPAALLLNDFDGDRDLRVSRTELDAGVKAMFARADTNHDGSLSPLEFDALAQAHMGTTDSTPGRLTFDTNGDNQISQAEFAAGMTNLFDEFDKDHDSYVTRAEMVRRLEAPTREQPNATTGARGADNDRGDRGGRREP